MANKFHIGDDITKERFLEELEKNYGNCSKTYTTLGISYKRYDKWRKEDPEFNAAVKALQKRTVEWVENKMFQFINGEVGDPKTQERMIRFYLNARGGYTENKNLNVNSSNTVDINTTIEEIKQELS